MRVLLTVPSLAREFGGPVVKTRSLARALTEVGCRVVVAGGGRSGDGQEVALGALGSFHATPVPRRVASLYDAVAASDIVHVVGYRDPVGTLAAMRAARLRRPFLIEPAGMHRRRLRSVRLKASYDATVGRRLVAKASHLIATSMLERNELIADGVAQHAITIRPNGIDVAHRVADGAEFRARFGIPASAALIVSIGRLTAKKGLTELLAAANAIDDAWLLVAGPDDGDGTLAKLRRGIDSPRRALIVGGWMESADKQAAFAAANVFCLPSATENFGTVAAEAAAAGTPVIVSDQCGVIEYLDPAATVVVPAHDLEALQAALVATLRDGGRASAAERAAAGVRRRLKWSAIAREQLSLYESVLNGRLNTAHRIR